MIVHKATAPDGKVHYHVEPAGGPRGQVTACMFARAVGTPMWVPLSWTYQRAGKFQPSVVLPRYGFRGGETVLTHRAPAEFVFTAGDFASAADKRAAEQVLEDVQREERENFPE